MEMLDDNMKGNLEMVEIEAAACFIIKTRNLLRWDKSRKLQ
jgi:hypothetical protein